MQGRDGRLQLIRTRAADPQRGFDHPGPLGDPFRVPSRPVLILEQHELPVRPRPRLASRIVEEHQCQEPGDLGLIGEQLDHDPAQPDRLGRELAPDDGFPRRRGVTLVEDQVQDAQDPVESLGQQVERRHPVRDARVADLSFGAHEPLGERGLRNQECASDLRRGQAAQGPQRQADPGVERQRRVAAREDQSESVVRDRHRFLRVTRFDRGQLRLDHRLPSQPLRLLPEAPTAAEPIDRAIARRRRDPGGRVVRDAPFRPALERGDERLLDDLLGEVEVAEDADERRDRPPLLFAEQAVDDLVGGAVGGDQSAAAAPTGAPASAPDVSMTGRTSTEPCRTPGQGAASASAASRSGASMR